MSGSTRLDCLPTWVRDLAGDNTSTPKKLAYRRLRKQKKRISGGAALDCEVAARSKSRDAHDPEQRTAKGVPKDRSQTQRAVRLVEMGSDP
jgi:hypothetical protein